MRKWLEVISPKVTNDLMGCLTGKWMPQMDRCWDSDDGFQVCSRVLKTAIGEVEHVSIIRTGSEYLLSDNGKADIPWKIKHEIRNELFGDDRIAIEVFPKADRLVDVCDVYHLWLLPKGFELPFGIHPNDVQGEYIERDAYHDFAMLVDNTKVSAEMRKEANK